MVLLSPNAFVDNLFLTREDVQRGLIGRESTQPSHSPTPTNHLRLSQSSTLSPRTPPPAVP